MKLGVVYTTTVKELVADVEAELYKYFGKDELEIKSYSDPSILWEARDEGRFTEGCGRRLMDMYEKAAKDGAQIIYNICSSVGDFARLAKPLYEMMGIGFVRIDEDMAREAVRQGDRIGVIATLKSTLEPTARLIKQCAAEAGRTVEVFPSLADGAFGADRVKFEEKLIEAASVIADEIDVLLLAQGSMAYATDAIAARFPSVKVYSSPSFGAAAVKAAADKINN